MKDPGLHRSLAGDGVATAVSGLLGGPPNTTYGENIGVMAITRVFAVWVIGGAAVIAIAMSFFPPRSARSSAPSPPRSWAASASCSSGSSPRPACACWWRPRSTSPQTRNLIIASVILVIGIGGAKIHLGAVEIGEMSLATYVGVLLNLVLPAAKGTPEGATSAAPDV